MIKKNCVVLYKNSPAVVVDCDKDKFEVKYCSFALTKENIEKAGSKNCPFAVQKVREKDIQLLYPSIAESADPAFAVPQISIEKLISFTDDALESKVAEAWELLSMDESTKDAAISFDELSLLVDNNFSAANSWAVFNAVNSSLCFKNNGTGADAQILFVPRRQEEIDSLKAKADAKENEGRLRAEFLERLKARKLLPEDSIHMGDVEALALGKTDKSRTMADISIGQTPEKAHKLLLDTGLWEITRNPYPLRWGLSMQSASEGLVSPPQDEQRLELDGTFYAIDNAWSSDPDDAVGFDGKYLWVHIADPASTVTPDSSIDIAARNRGATLYIPEGASRMLCENSLSDYALGLCGPDQKSLALSFRLELDEKGAIADCQVFKTRVKVECITYNQADDRKEEPQFKVLFDIADRNRKRRMANGSVEIQMPESHITVDPETKKVSIVPVVRPEAASMIQEMMLMAGEGAAHFAFKNQIPFPYISQESPDLPENVREGLAGQLQLVKSMHKRSVGVTPMAHAGIGIGMYSQVTSPLRRYSDLVAHMQLRAFLDGRKLIDKDTMLEKISAGDEAAIACKKAERKSNLHWTLVYLLQNPQWEGEAVLMDIKGKDGIFMISEFAQQATIPLTQTLNFNDVVRVKASNINLPELTVDYVIV